MSRTGGSSVPASDAEKTLIDLVYFGEPPGKDVIERLAEVCDRKVVEGYLGRSPGRFRAKLKAETGLHQQRRAPLVDDGERATVTNDIE